MSNLEIVEFRKYSVAKHRLKPRRPNYRLMMKRTITIATALLLLSLAMTVSPYNIHLARASPYLDPTLAGGVSIYSAAQTVEVVIVLSHTPTSNDAQSVQSLSTVS